MSKVLWELNSPDALAQVVETAEQFELQLHVGVEGCFSIELSSEDLLDLAFTIYEELG